LSLVFVDGRLGSAYRYSRKSLRLTAIIRATKREAGSALNCCARRCRLRCSFLRLALLHYYCAGMNRREEMSGKRFALNNPIHLLVRREFIGYFARFTCSMQTSKRRYESYKLTFRCDICGRSLTPLRLGSMSRSSRECFASL